MATIKEQIRAEIERLEKIDYPCDNYEQSVGFYDALDRVKSFLDTIPEQEDGKALLYVAEKSYKIGLRDGKASKEQLVDGLEDEAVQQGIKLKNMSLEDEIKRYTKEKYHETFGNGQGTLDEFDWEDIAWVIEDTAKHFAEWGAEHLKK